MSRKMVGVSEGLHTELSEAAKAAGVPMTLVLETLLNKFGEVEWSTVKENYQNHKPSWKNIRKSVLEYREKNPKADDKKLSELTGFSIAQVEVITHSAHKRCLRHLADKPKVKPDALAKAGGVSAKFAKRIWEQAQGVSKIPPQELYLWDATGQTPTPNPHTIVI
jgi:hypothetical protein